MTTLVRPRRFSCPVCGRQADKVESLTGMCVDASCPKIEAAFNDTQRETIDHPKHYGGADNPYEAIKVIEAWELSFNLGNVAKYILRSGKKGDRLEDLKKARWYLEREIRLLDNQS